jgi:hypothetical protein
MALAQILHWKSASWPGTFWWLDDATSDGALRRALRPPAEHCHRLHHTEGHARGRQQEIHEVRDVAAGKWGGIAASKLHEMK